MKLLDLALNPRKAMLRYSPFRMSLTEGQENELTFLFTKRSVRSLEVRATHDPVVRHAYGTDAASLPADVDLLVKRVPGSVVMPADRGELLKLLAFAQANNVPLTPRAGGTSGYGGAVPAESGVVVDMRLFNRVLAVDAAAKTVRVEPSVVWMDLEDRLNAEGLALRQYPTSALYATVGGWVAMGGGGVGSFQFGGIRESLASATVLHPDGQVATYEGADLDLIEGAEGITGFILEVTLKVRERTDIVPLAAAFDTIHPAAELVRTMRGDGAVFSVSILGPEFIALKQEAAGVRHLPKEKIVVVAALHADKADGSKGAITAAVTTLGGEMVKDAAARWEWDTRFDHLNFKRFGPTVVAAEAVSHVDKLEHAWVAANGAMAGDADEKALWAIAIDRDHVDLVGYRLADERIPNFPLSSGNALNFIHAVKRTGGRAYAPGMLLSTESNAVLGKDRVKMLAKWKKANDKQEIMNPGKVLQARVRGAPPVKIGMAMKPGEPMLRMLRGKYIHSRPEGTDPSLRAMAAVHGAAYSPRLAHVADRAFACSRTGRTNTLGDLHMDARFDTMMPRGVIRAAQIVLQGKAVPGKDLRTHMFSLPCVPTYDGRSQNAVPIYATLQAMREVCVKAAGAGPETKGILRNIDANGHVFDKGAKDDWMPGAAPAGAETTTWFVAGDSGMVKASKAAAAAFNVLVNAGVSFRALGTDEPSSVTHQVRAGAWRAAIASMGGVLGQLDKAFKTALPERVITFSDEDAHAVRTTWPALAADNDRTWTPDVESFTGIVARLIKENRLEFNAGDAADVVFVPSPFASAEDVDAAKAVLAAMPGVDAEVFDGSDTLLPDVVFSITKPEVCATLASQAAAAIAAAHGDRTILVACPDLATALAAGKVKTQLMVELVAGRMKMSEGGPAVAAPVAEEEVGFKEYDIPEGAFRVELVKQDCAIPVHPDENILDAAEALGYEMPSDCRAGSCVSCSARWEGTPPDQSEGQSLSPDEQKSHVLTCIAKPKGPVKIWSGEQP